MAADEQSMPFIKNLASSDRKIRTHALATLRTFLAGAATSRSLSRLEHLKLWKGLFFSLWMCDRPIPQQNLCADLAGLVAVLPAPAVAPWLAAFFETVGREWTGIDVLRMEKFLLLVRRVLAAGLAWMRDGHTADAETESESESRPAALLRVLAEWPLDSTGDLARVPVGLRLHVLDIWVDEAERAGLVGDGSTEQDAAFLDGVRALVEAQKKSPSKPVRARASDSLADERLPWHGKTAGVNEDAEDAGSDAGSFGGWDDDDE